MNAKSYNLTIPAKKRQKIKMKKIVNTIFACFILLFMLVVFFIIKNANTSNIMHPNLNIKNTAFYLLLVNANNQIPDNFSVPLMTLENGCQIDSRIYNDLQDMFNAANNDGIFPVVSNAFRTEKDQQKLLTDKINAYIKDGYSKNKAMKLAKMWVALPNTSEHQLGLALDINAQKDKCTNEAVYKWLNENSYKYGFILRYPANKVNLTGVNYEPWHFRYVSKPVAKNIYEQGICLEEFL